MFTKALGTGVISTAIKQGKAEPAWIDAAVQVDDHAEQARRRSNRLHGKILACMPHDRHDRLRPDRPRREMAAGRRRLHANHSAGKIPLLEGALDCVRAGYIPGGLKNNREFAECLVEYDAGVPDDVRALLFDPQTAGGLLISTPDGPSLTQALNDAAVGAVEIGAVMPKGKPRIYVST